MLYWWNIEYKTMNGNKSNGFYYIGKKIQKLQNKVAFVFYYFSKNIFSTYNLLATVWTILSKT